LIKYVGGDLESFIEKHGGKKELIDLYLKLVHDILMGLKIMHGNS
jgi:hypothetical protein